MLRVVAAIEVVNTLIICSVCDSLTTHSVLAVVNLDWNVIYQHCIVYVCTCVLTKFMTEEIMLVPCLPVSLAAVHSKELMGQF